MRKISIILFLSLTLIGLTSFIAETQVAEEKIKWLSFQEAVELNKKNPKKIYIDVYTNWCGWCKVMDNKTFSHPAIIKNMNKYFYAVKLNAEMKDTVIFDNKTFVNPEPSKRGSVHQLAAALLSNKMGYPSSVFLDEKFSMAYGAPIQSYLAPENLEPILVFIGQEKNKEISWDDFSKTFKGEVKQSQ